MIAIRTTRSQPWALLRLVRASGALLLAAMVGLSGQIPALAGSPTDGAPFAHGYVTLYFDGITKANLALTLREPSFPKLVETRQLGLPGFARQNFLVIGGIHQAAKAVTIGAAAGEPVRFSYRPGKRIILSVGEKSIETGLLAAHVRPMASFVEEGNNGLIGLNDRATHNGKSGYSPKVAPSYIDTEEGYWLLWADAIAEDSFYRVEFPSGEFPNGLTIVDSKRPVTITTDGTPEVRGGEPLVAFWKRPQGEPGRVLRSDDLGLVMTPRDQNDIRAIEAVRRVFKWAPVMRLAAESDPAAFKAFVHDLEKVRIETVRTPSLLIRE